MGHNWKRSQPAASKRQANGTVTFCRHGFLMKTWSAPTPPQTPQVCNRYSFTPWTLVCNVLQRLQTTLKRISAPQGDSTVQLAVKIPKKTTEKNITTHFFYGYNSECFSKPVRTLTILPINIKYIEHIFWGKEMRKETASNCCRHMPTSTAHIPTPRAQIHPMPKNPHAEVRYKLKGKRKM